MRNAFVLVSLLTLAAVPAHAEQVYRWVDQSGHVTYQDTPPPPGARDVHVERISGSGKRTAKKARVPVTLYVIPHCAPCDSVRRYLDRRDVGFTEVNIENQPKQRAAMQRKTGYASVPTVVVGHTAINGFNPSWLGSELTKAGYAKKPARAKHK
ncbi:MAG: glutaredoxin domain-containing protein [Acidiferrobacteraceae bacterium]